MTLIGRASEYIDYYNWDEKKPVKPKTHDSRVHIKHDPTGDFTRSIFSLDDFRRMVTDNVLHPGTIIELDGHEYTYQAKSIQIAKRVKGGRIVIKDVERMVFIKEDGGMLT